MSGRQPLCDDVDDADHALLDELTSLRRVQALSFHPVKLNIKHSNFIQSNVPSTSDFLHSMMCELKNQQVKTTRYLERIIPVCMTTTCKRDDLMSAFSQILQPYITSAGQCRQYSLVVKITNNDVLGKDLISEMIADIMIGWYQTECADVVILVNVIRGLCCISVAINYFQLAKYNVARICANS